MWNEKRRLWSTGCEPYTFSVSKGKRRIWKEREETEDCEVRSKTFGGKNWVKYKEDFQVAGWKMSLVLEFILMLMKSRW